MSGGQARVELQIDVLTLKGQRAQVLPGLLPGGLVAAVLEEFRELEQLGERADEYALVRADTGAALDEQIPLSQQVSAGARLALVERVTPLPEGASRPGQPLYLREQAGQLYRLSWVPALIGRRDQRLPGDELLAVDLARHDAGLRVSRRHARVIERGGAYFVEGLSQNPTVVRRSDGGETPVAGAPVALAGGDVIYLVSSQIALKFLVGAAEDGQ